MSYLDLEMAVAYWNLVLTGRFKFLDLWNRFLLVREVIFCNTRFHPVVFNFLHILSISLTYCLLKSKTILNILWQNTVKYNNKLHKFSRYFQLCK